MGVVGRSAVMWMGVVERSGREYQAAAATISKMLLEAAVAAMVVS